MLVRHADIIYGLVITAITGALLVHTFSDVYEFNPLIESVSTVFFPRIILIALMLCAMGLMTKGFRNSMETETLPQIDIGRTAWVFVAAAGTAAGLWFIGYFYVMPVGVFLTGLALGYRKKYVLATVAVVATIMTWIALGYFAHVIFPTEFRLF